MSWSMHSIRALQQTYSIAQCSPTPSSRTGSTGGAPPSSFTYATHYILIGLKQRPLPLTYVISNHQSRLPHILTCPMKPLSLLRCDETALILVHIYLLFFVRSSSWPCSITIFIPPSPLTLDKELQCRHSKPQKTDYLLNGLLWVVLNESNCSSLVLNNALINGD